MSPGSDSPDHFIAPSLEELQPLFPSYKLEGFIAQGGMGAVYRATQRSLDRSVAIKILPREFGADEAFREAFTAEAKAMARLNHPSLIGVYDFGDVDGMLFIVMEFVGGGSLHDACLDLEVVPARAAELVAAICRGLAHAHEAGVLHRDIKPGNILLTEDAAPKIGDFGLARRVGDHVDAGEPVYGTPGYAAPETCFGGAADQRADLFSVGVLLHRLLTGLEPDGGILPPASSRCNCPPVLDEIIRHATQADPALRYATAADMAQDLEKAKNARHRKGAALLQVGSGPSETAAHRRPSVAPQKSSGAFAAAALLMLAAIGGGAFFMDRTGGAADSSTPPAAVPAVVLLPDKQTTPNPIPLPREESPPPPPAPEAAPAESASAALARLQTQLAAGTRSEFPIGTMARDGNHYLILEDPMSWPEAQAFATSHGAHLAVFPTPEDQSWIRAQLQPGQSPWIGAGRTANNSWQWIDGSSWAAPASFSANTGTHQCLALSASGELQAALASQPRSLILQWHDNGTNPGTLDAQLKRTAAALTTDPSAPLPYPVGTRTLHDSHFLAVQKAMTWDEARRLAESVGAHLTVPSSAREHDWIRSTFSEDLQNGQSLWLGGSRPKPGDRWQWLNGEAWSNLGWASDQPGPDQTHNRIALRGGPGNEPPAWVAVDGNERKVEGLLLEWSPPREVVEVPAFVLKPWLDEVNRKIATRVGPDLDEFDRNRRKLVQDYNRSMGRLVRKELSEAEANPFERSRGGRGGGFDWRGYRTATLETLEEALKEAAKTNQLLTSLPERTSNAIRDEHAEASANLKLLEEACELKLRAHLTFYLEGISGKTADLIGLGYLDSARELNDTVAPLRDNPAAFVKALYPDSPRGTLPWTAGPDRG
ncbi:MAG: protein kinase [Verrucomicrobia bacterium]|nr:protein kinase [Verrucomicrobiota bacterium]